MEPKMMGMQGKRVFVTVGTTCFDALVKAVDSQQVKEELSRKGYTELLIQMGCGTYIPSKVSEEEGSLAVDYLTFSPSIADYLKSASLIISHAEKRKSILSALNLLVSEEEGSLAVDYLTFSPSIADYLKSASLIISHAGSGSIFETLRLGKPLIVVVNEDLMDNHQSELAEELAERKHLFYARPQTLHQTIQTMELESLVPYSPGNPMPVVKLMNKFLGFPTD